MDEESSTRKRTFTLFGLELDTRATIIIIVTTLLLMVDHYHRFIPGETYAQVLRAKAYERVIYYLIIPLLIILLIFRDRPSAYGFTFGNWREGLLWTFVLALLAAPIMVFVGRSPAMVSYYASVERPVGDVLLNSAIDLVGWEFVFRGFILFGLLRVAGPNAILLQAVPFAMAHIGKPELETLSTIFGGTIFGILAWRGRSFVYPFVLHWFVNILVILTAMGHLGNSG